MSGAVGHDRALSGRYALERELGRGGMGVVYLARDLRHDRAVAVKFLPAELASAVGAARFTREIRTLAALGHPHVLPLHDSGVADGELFYVMPHIEGDSLRQRLQRRGPMAVSEALAVGRQVVDALAYAHACGIVHRDIKPENILLDRRGHAFVADFGIARVLEPGATERGITTTPIRIGTPTYMSPEQIVGDSELDGRSDIYSFGCVLFEMLSGAPPFPAEGAHSLTRRHLVEPPPPIRNLRPDVSPSLAALIERMLAKDPDRRFRSADELLLAVDDEIAGVASAPGRGRSNARQWLPLASLVAIALLLAGARSLFRDTPSVDAHRWMILPIEWRDDSAAGAASADEKLHAAFGRWRNLALVDPAASEAAYARAMPLLELFLGKPALDDEAARRAGLRVGAGIVVRPLAAVVGDSIHFEFHRLVSTDEGAASRITFRVPRTAPSFELVADSILFGRTRWDDDDRSDIGTNDWDARRRYGLAHDAVDAWDFEGADSLLSNALRADPEFARAAFWLAQVRSWRGQAPERWIGFAERALAMRDDLTVRERTLAQALVFVGTGRHADACDGYRSLLNDHPRDFSALYGLAECLRWDRRVVADPTSPSGWRFVSSHHAAAEAYLAAFGAHPSSLRAFRARSFELLRARIFLKAGTVWSGRDAEQGLYVALPEWRGDSLAFVPYPLAESDRLPDSERVDRALDRQRNVFLALARRWAAGSPADPDAMYAVATALQIMRDPAASEALRDARSRARTSEQRRRADVALFWHGLRMSVPHDPAGFEEAARLGVSLLDDSPARTPSEAAELAPVAAVLGRPFQAAALSRSAVIPGEPTERVERLAAALLAFAGLGAPVDSIRRLEGQIEGMIRSTIAEGDRENMRRLYLEQAAIVAFPEPTFEYLRSGAPRSMEARAQAALARGDTAAARATISDFQGRDAFDMVLGAAALASALGDSGRAAEWLDRALADVAWVEPGLLENDVAKAGAFARAMIMRADIAHAAGADDDARRWAEVVVRLWLEADPSLEPLTARMRTLTNQQRGSSE